MKFGSNVLKLLLNKFSKDDVKILSLNKDIAVFQRGCFLLAHPVYIILQCKANITLPR
jgi:hypothetical protein